MSRVYAPDIAMAATPPAPFGKFIPGRITVCSFAASHKPFEPNPARESGLTSRYREVLVSSFVAGLITGCVIGVSGTALLLLFVATLTDGYSNRMYELSLRGIACAAVALLAVTGLSYTLKLDKAGAILLLSLSVLVIAKLGGFRYGIGASVVAAVLLSFLFLPPIGSLWVIGSDNRLALVLFLLSTIAGSRLIGGKKRLPG